MPAVDKRQRRGIELHSPSGYRPAIVAFYTEAIQLERKRNATEEISHEDQTAIQDRQHRKLLSRIVRRDLSRQLIQPGSNLRLAIENSLQITLHQLWSVGSPLTSGGYTSGRDI